MGILSPKRVSPKRVKTADGDQRMAIDGGFAERVRGGVWNGRGVGRARVSSWVDAVVR